MTKVALATDGVFPGAMGGMARHSRHLAEQLALLGAEVEVFHPGPPANFEVPGVTERLVAHPRHTFKGHYAVDSWLYSRNVRAALAASTPRHEVVYAQGLSVWSGIGDLGAPCLVNPHGLEMFQTDVLGHGFDTAPIRAAFRRVLGKADRVVSLGGGLTQLLQSSGRVDADRIVVLPNGVDLSYVDSFGSTEPTSRAEATFVFVGRLAFNKGLPELIAAFTDNADLEARLVIVGDGEMKDQVASLASSGSIQLAGRLSDGELFGLLRSASCFVLPTKGEGMPTAVLEAMACELPVVATPVGAIPDMVDSSTGILVPPGDVDALRAAIGRMVQLDANKRRVMGRAGRRRVEERFAWPEVAARTLDVLQDMARSRTAAHG